MNQEQQLRDKIEYWIRAGKGAPERERREAQLHLEELAREYKQLTGYCYKQREIDMEVQDK